MVCVQLERSLSSPCKFQLWNLYLVLWFLPFGLLLGHSSSFAFFSFLSSVLFMFYLPALAFFSAYSIPFLLSFISISPLATVLSFPFPSYFVFVFYFFWSSLAFGLSPSFSSTPPTNLPLIFLPSSLFSSLFLLFSLLNSLSFFSPSLSFLGLASIVSAGTLHQMHPALAPNRRLPWEFEMRLVGGSALIKTSTWPPDYCFLQPEEVISRG